MSTFPQISPEQWEQLQKFVARAVGVARFMSGKLAILQWIAMLSAVLLSYLIYQLAALQPWMAGLALLILLLPALAIWRIRRRLQDVANAPQAINDLRDAIMSIPGALREAGLDVQEGQLKFATQGGVWATLRQLRTAKHAVGQVKTRMQDAGSPEFVMSVLAMTSPVFIGVALLAVIATFILAMATALTALAWLISQ